MACFPDSFLLLVCAMMLVSGSLLLVSQAQGFLQKHGGPALTSLQIGTVSGVFTAVGLIQIAYVLKDVIHLPDAMRNIALLACGIPVVLLDLRNYWLPLRYTNGLWLTGLLFTLQPASPLTLAAALTSSVTMFMILRLFHAIAKHIRGEEGFGLGDVHLIAALCTWFPWQLASLLSGLAFFLLVTGALLVRKKMQPYAPWLFGLLAMLIGTHFLPTLSGIL